MSEIDVPTLPGHPDDIDPDAAGTALVEIEPGVAVVYGDQVPEGLNLIPLSLFDARAEASLAGAVSKATGLANVGAQAVNGVMQAQGLVRLAPETVKVLQTANPVTSGGWNLGVVASGGKFSHVIRWAPATGATAASVVASLGPALGMLMIQFQLSDISSLAKHNLDLARMLLDEARVERRAAVKGDYEALSEMIRHARSVGSVSPAIFKEVRGAKRDLDAHWDAIQGILQDHVAKLGSKRGHKERREYLLDNGEAILADAHSLLMAQASWFMYQALWAGHLLNTAETDPDDAALLQDVIEDARKLHDQSLSETDHLLGALIREFTIMAELEGDRTFVIGGQRRASKDVAVMARQLQESLAAVRSQNAPPQEREVSAPTVSVFKSDVPDVLLRVLRMRLDPRERLVALASASTTAIFEDSIPDHLLRGVQRRLENNQRLGGVRRRLEDSQRLAALVSSTDAWSVSWVAVTDQRVLLMKPDDLKSHGLIEHEIPVDDIRYVRTRDGGAGKGPAINLITKDEGVTFEFGSWARAGERRRKAEEFGDVLRHFMHIPAQEVPTLRIPELEAPADGRGPRRADLPEGDAPRH